MGLNTYPPCLSCSCTGNACRGIPRFQGMKLEWPELVGSPQTIAKARIEKENQYVTAILLPQGNLRPYDVCCNRVWLEVDQNGVVIVVPKVG